jgi:hypothetical protein
MFSIVCLKSLRKLTTWQNATAVLSTNQYILVYTEYIGVHTSRTLYTSLYTRMSTLYTRMSTWILLQDRICVYKHCVSGYKSVYKRIHAYKTSCKICIVSIFEPWLSCTLQGCSDRFTTSVDVYSVYHMIYVRLHITVWLELSRPRPLRRPWCQPKPPCWHGFEARLQV